MDSQHDKFDLEEFIASPHEVLERTWKDVFRSFGGNILWLMDYLGDLTRLGLQTLKSVLRPRFPWQAFFDQCEAIGVKSFSLISLISIFMGMVFALQFAVGLGRFGLKIYIGQIIGIAICRELGPVMVSLMLAARVGSGIAAELGSMVVTEQVLAIEALGAHPVQKLVMPRVLAVTLMAPILVTLGDVIGMVGGMWMTVLEAGVSPEFFVDQLRRTVSLGDYFSGITKSIFFGFLIGLIACHQGLKTEGGTEGVGRATTRAVVIASLVVFIADFFLTKFFILL